MKENITIPKAIIITGVIISLSLYGGSFNLRPEKADLAIAQPKAPAAQAPASPVSISLARVTDEDHIIGSKDAPVVIVAYTDLECPFCKKYHETLKQALVEYGGSGKLAIVYRHYPIDQLHSKARKEAEAAECAADVAGTIGANGAFWGYIDRLFEITPSNNKLDLAELPKIAKEIGINVGKFQTCMAEGRYADKVNASVTAAIQAGAKGTPYSIILAGGEALPVAGGAVSYDTLKALIEEGLTKTK